jgi:hypothetical protein
MGSPGVGDLTLKFLGDAGVVGRADMLKVGIAERSVCWSGRRFGGDATDRGGWVKVD